MTNFVLGANVHENVTALRRALGSVTKELSRNDLAKLLNQRSTERQLNGSTVGRWEDDVEPDIQSIVSMAELAGVPFEAFALGDPAKREATKRPTTRGNRVPIKRPARGQKGA